MDAVKTLNVLKGPVRQFQELQGRILCRAEQIGNEELRLYLTDDHYVRFYHYAYYCESVRIEDVCGNLDDLVGEVLTEAELVEGYTADPLNSHAESYTWTFYRFGTRRGSVTVRWYGESNGYYSERVDVEIVGSGQED